MQIEALSAIDKEVNKAHLSIELLKTCQPEANSEAAYRKNNNYNNFKGKKGSRKKIILAGSNGGLLHAFDSANGEELWAFIPPNILSRLKEMKSTKENNTNSISGVDGTPVVKDIYYDNPTYFLLILYFLSFLLIHLAQQQMNDLALLDFC